MENEIEFEFKGKLPESCFNELIEFIYDKGGCLQNFPIPFCGVHIDKATCLKCIGDALKLPQARVSGSLQPLTVNRVSEMMQKLSKETWIALQGDEHGWREWWNERNKMNVNSNDR